MLRVEKESRCNNCADCVECGRRREFYYRAYCGGCREEYVGDELLYGIGGEFYCAECFMEYVRDHMEEVAGLLCDEVGSVEDLAQ